MDERIEEERSVAALAMTLLSGTRDRVWRRNGRVLSTPVALVSADLTVDLMKMAVFSVNLHAASASAMSEGLPSGERGREVMLALGFDYAIDAAPDSGDVTLEGVPIVDCDDLAAQVREIEAALGPIPLDTDMVSRVLSAAYGRLSADPEAPPVRGVQA